MSLIASNILFGKSTSEDLIKLDEDTFLSVFEGVPQFELKQDDINCGLLDLLSEKTNIFDSKGEARRMITSNAVSINKEKISLEFQTSSENLINKKYLLVQKGKKTILLLRSYKIIYSIC